MDSLHHRLLLSGEQRWELRGGRGTCWTRCDQPVWSNVTESNILFHNKAESLLLTVLTCVQGWWGSLRDRRVHFQLHPGHQKLPAASGYVQDIRAGGALQSFLASIVSLASCPWVNIHLLVPSSSCSQQALWILFNQVMISGNRCFSLSINFLSIALWNWNPGCHRERDFWDTEKMLQSSRWVENAKCGVLKSCLTELRNTRITLKLCHIRRETTP